MNDSHSTSARSTISIVWLGDARRPEFAATFDLLTSRASVVALPDLNDTHIPAGELSPALVIVAQGFAGEIGEADIVRLRRRYPTAALVRIAASWCEGELRSTPLLHGVKRYLAHQATAPLLADLAKLERGLRPDWGLPATTTDDESLFAAIDPPPPQPADSPHIGIAASDPQVERWLRDLSRRKLMSEPAIYRFETGTGFENSASVPTLVLWDVPHSVEAAAMQLDRLKRALAERESKIIALANFPRRDQIARWRDAGVAEVLGKPATDATLLACIAGATSGFAT